MEKNYLYNVAVHEAGHAVMAVYQGGAVTELAIGDEVKEEGTAGYCRTAVDGFMAKVWTSLAGPVTSAIHEDTRVWEQFAFGGGQADFDRTFDRWLDLLVPHSLRAEFGFPEDSDALTTYVEAVLEGWRPNGEKGAEIRRIRRFARECSRSIEEACDGVHGSAQAIRAWIIAEGWFMPRVYRLADALVEKEAMTFEEIVRWFVRDGAYRRPQEAA